jgi:protein TonB
MAYLTPDTPRRRTATIGAVAAVHGVMAVALLSGFAGGVVKVIEKKSMPAWTYVDPPKLVPGVTPTAAPADSKRKAETKIDLRPAPDPFPMPIGGFDPGPMPTGGFGGDTGTIIGPVSPRPAPTASFTARGARPLTEPGGWVSDADYPASALRKGEQGVTRFAVTIGPGGRVRDCAVTRSSGSPELDAVTCAKVSRRARFDPASDERGGAVAGRYANAINWRIPE